MRQLQGVGQGAIVGHDAGNRAEVAVAVANRASDQVPLFWHGAAQRVDQRQGDLSFPEIVAEAQERVANDLNAAREMFAAELRKARQ